MFSDPLWLRPPRQTNILVAEDEPAVRGFIRDLLHDRGFVLLEAADGEQALQAARAWAAPLHLLIADFYLPKLSGHDLAQRLLEQRPEIKVLFLAGYGTEFIVGHNLIGPKTGFLPKPFGRPELIDRIQALLEGRDFNGCAVKPSLRGVLERILQSSCSAAAD